MSRHRELTQWNAGPTTRQRFASNPAGRVDAFPFHFSQKMLKRFYGRRTHTHRLFIQKPNNGRDDLPERLTMRSPMKSTIRPRAEQWSVYRRTAIASDWCWWPCWHHSVTHIWRWQSVWTTYWKRQWWKVFSSKPVSMRLHPRWRTQNVDMVSVHGKLISFFANLGFCFGNIEKLRRNLKKKFHELWKVAIEILKSVCEQWKATVGFEILLRFKKKTVSEL